MANKNARILWTVMTREGPFDPKHVSIKTQCTLALGGRAGASAPALAPGAA